MKAGAAKKDMGARSEHLAVVHLLDEGFSVFRAVGAHAPYDLIAVRGQTVLKVEVRSGTRWKGSDRKDGFSKKVNDPSNPPDIFLVVFPDGDIKVVRASQAVA